MVGTKFGRLTWAFYAAENNKHTGVCLKLRGVELDQQIEEKFRDRYKVYKGPIEYNDNKIFRPPVWLMDVSQNSKELSQKARDLLLDHYEWYFLLKSEDWKTENEFRWLIHSEEDYPENISIEGILEEVILGEDFSEDDEANIWKMCKELKVPIGQVKWENGIPEHRIIYPL